MKPCREIRSIFIDALYGALPEARQQAFQQHLASCNKCSAAYKKMSRTLKVMSDHPRSEPDAKFWDNYWDRLSSRIESEKPKQNRLRWIYRVAAVLFLIGAGMILGRFTLRPTRVVTTFKGDQETQVVVPASLNERANDFLGRSEVLLLMIVNLTPDQEGSNGLDFSKQKEISNTLIQEASLLKKELAQPDRRRLQKLVSDLELILMQIANLERQNDTPGIEFLKSGVDRKGLLLKINLERMRMAEPLTDNESASSKKSI